MNAQLFLASASPRRSELLSQLGVSFETVNAPIEEVALPNEPPLSFVKRMAIEKALSGFQKVDGNRVWVIGGDTLVLFEGKALGKPRNEAEGIRMLKQLSGNTHEVLSAVAIVFDGMVHSALSKTQVRFRSLSDEDIMSYWQTGEPLDKAGSYAIQGLGARFIRSINGSYSGVMGLPLYELDQLLMETKFYKVAHYVK